LVYRNAFFVPLDKRNLDVRANDDLVKMSNPGGLGGLSGLDGLGGLDGLNGLDGSDMTEERRQARAQYDKQFPHFVSFMG
jgi:hypothetical protein